MTPASCTCASLATRSLLSTRSDSAAASASHGCQRPQEHGLIARCDVGIDGRSAKTPSILYSVLSSGPRETVEDHRVPVGRDDAVRVSCTRATGAINRYDDTSPMGLCTLYLLAPLVSTRRRYDSNAESPDTPVAITHFSGITSTCGPRSFLSDAQVSPTSFGITGRPYPWRAPPAATTPLRRTPANRLPPGATADYATSHVTFAHLHHLSRYPHD